jgi:hypothetical protein
VDTSPFSIEWTFDDEALYALRPHMLPRERTRLLYFADAADVWANLIRGWPAMANGSPRKLRIHAVFEELEGGDPADKARVDRKEVLDSVVEGFPSFGTIRIDLADIDELIADGARFKQTVVHEIGHVLGLGTLFDSRGLVRDKETAPVYSGERGSLAFAALLGRDEGAVPVPLQEEPPGTTRAFHWDEAALRLDIMSTHLDAPFVPPVGSPDGVAQDSVISTVSAGALVDLGYAVRMERADRVPASLQRRAQGRQRRAPG